MPAARVRVTLRSGCPWDGQCGAAGTGLRCGQQDGSDKPANKYGPPAVAALEGGHGGWPRLANLPARLGHPPGIRSATRQVQALLANTSQHRGADVGLPALADLVDGL
jgi:hypothetical protein